jgi:GAF domain-containing protein
MAQPPDAAVDLVAAFSRLQALTLDTPRVGEFLSELAGLAPQLAGPPLSGSVTIRGEHEAFTAASSDAFAYSVDETQYDGDEGPCLEALRTGRIVHVPDMGSESRWPRYTPDAAAAGVRSSLSLPLSVGADTIGALNLYCTQPDGFDERLRQSLAVFAAQAAAALAMVLRQARQGEISAQLEQALASRTTIDQALGILMAQQHCTAEQAFGLLKAHSQNTNRKIRDVAEDIVRRVSGEPAQPGRPFAP